VSGPIGTVFRHFLEGAEDSSCFGRDWKREAYSISLQRCRYITVLSYSCVASGYIGTYIQVVLSNVIVQHGMKAWLPFFYFSVVLMEAYDRVRVGV
jgi:hypothetical protein